VEGMNGQGRQCLGGGRVGAGSRRKYRESTAAEVPRLEGAPDPGAAMMVWRRGSFGLGVERVPMDQKKSERRAAGFPLRAPLKLFAKCTQRE
jgi:hypothetical protein